MRDIDRFISGFRRFQKEFLGANPDQHDMIKAGQTPKTMIIGCSDSRVDPAILTRCAPGDIFTVRNVANLVPPFEKSGGQHGVSAALEFAVCYLNVENIIILGHSQCGGIHALMTGECDGVGEGLIARWMSLALPVRDQIARELPGKSEELQHRAAEQAAILLSIENLSSFPFVTNRVKRGLLSLHGWYFDLKQGELLEYRPTTGAFERIE